MTSRNPTGPTLPGARRKRSKTPQFVALGMVLVCALAALVRVARNSAERRAAHVLPNPVVVTSDSLAAGKHDYETHCASCHGTQGDGKGDKAQGLWSTPTNFRNLRMDKRTDGDLYWITTKGSWPMPAFENKLSDRERWQLVNYIRTFAASAQDTPPPPDAR
jgi:mono/diheme cytochrome c family protein